MLSYLHLLKIYSRGLSYYLFSITAEYAKLYACDRDVVLVGSQNVCSVSTPGMTHKKWGIHGAYKERLQSQTKNYDTKFCEHSKVQLKAPTDTHLCVFYIINTSIHAQCSTTASKTTVKKLES